MLGGEQRPVELDDGVAGPVADVADDNPIGVQEVGYRGALLEELGARDIAQPGLALLAEDPLDRGAGPAGDGRLHHERVAVGGGDRIDDSVHRGEIGVARVGRRRPDCDEQQACVLQRGSELGREVQAPGVLGEQLLQAGLVDRHLPAPQPLDLGGVDVHAPDLAAELREAGGRDQADVAGADHSDWLALGTHQAGKASW